ncbi:hypothetical protein PN456_05335 [Nodularia spumigena CS-586/05]|uniref:hypothetical protein n=1 Tax=Nodularia spumigena TaxID=70799 RepID=UPI00232CC391|nr:hypothetical protein [Nodularia spumigena]MDB9345498.1 hypothetical protein [Nodularia spumigena CS-588/06]MDB9368381.1 hypothetical protein [Nodularia spumigena CS-586/05]
MSIKDSSKSIGSGIAISSSKIALNAFESYVEDKLNEKTEKKESKNLNNKVDVNAPKSF